MNLVRKIREKGLKNSIDAAKRRLAHSANAAVFGICRLFPLQDKSIVFESRGDMCDNAFALFEYIYNCEKFKDYKLTWLVEDRKRAKGRPYAGITYGSNDASKISFITYYKLAVSKYYIYDHDNLMMFVRKRANQQVIFLSHGVGFKAPKGSTGDYEKTRFGMVTSISRLGSDFLSNFLGCEKSVFRELGYPRNDYFFTDLTDVKQKLDEKYALSRYKTVFLWMPTFRQSSYGDLSEEYIASETGLPLLETKKVLDEFNEFLKQNGSVMILKVHPLQAELSIFKSSFSNILVMKNEELDEIGVQLYQLVAVTDALITDYSSISVDYMLLDRPIIFTLDDYEMYAASRGVYPENAIDYMAGYHVYSASDLKNAAGEIIQGLDVYKEKRREVCAVFHDNQDGNSSRRIAEYLKL